MTSLLIAIDDARIRELAARAPQRVTAAMERTVTFATLDMQGAVVKNTPVGATGFLRAAIDQDVNTGGLFITGRVFSTDVPVKTMAVEEGRRPGRMPPAAPIELWLRRKSGLDGRDLRSATFLVRRAIGRRGTRGARMFQRGFAEARPVVARRVDALRDELRRAV